MGILLLGAMAAFVKTSGLRKVVITFDTIMMSRLSGYIPDDRWSSMLGFFECRESVLDPLRFWYIRNGKPQPKPGLNASTSLTWMFNSFLALFSVAPC